jgi:hypothetical protein
MTNLKSGLTPESEPEIRPMELPEIVELILEHLDSPSLAILMPVNSLFAETAARILYSRPVAIPIQRTFMFLEANVFSDSTILPYWSYIRSLAFDVRILGPNMEELDEWISTERKLLEKCGDSLREIRYLRAVNLKLLSRSPILPLQIRRFSNDALTPRKLHHKASVSILSPRTLYIDTYLTREFPLVYLASNSGFVPLIERLVFQGMRPSFVPMPVFAANLRMPASVLCKNLTSLQLNVSLGSERLEPFADWFVAEGSSHAVKNVELNVFDAAVLSKLGSAFTKMESLYVNQMFLVALERFNQLGLKKVRIGNMIFPASFHQDLSELLPESKAELGKLAEAHVCQVLRFNGQPVDITIDRMTFHDKAGSQVHAEKGANGWI